MIETQPPGRRLRGAIVASAVAASCLAFVTTAPAMQPTARPARSLGVTETGNLHLLHKSGSLLNELGSAYGTLPGTMRAQFLLRTTEVTGSLTIYPRGGSLTISLAGFATSGGTIAHLSGEMSVQHGTGRYAHASGSASFTGIANRRSWAVQVRVVGRLRY